MAKFLLSVPPHKLHSNDAECSTPTVLGLLLRGVSILSVTLIVTGMGAINTQAAERVTLRLGFLEKTVELKDLEEFAQTGQVPEHLRLFSPVLTPKVREALISHLAIDAEIVDSFMQELLNTPDGQLLMQQLQEALPNSSVAEFQTALSLALQENDHLSILNVLRSHPQENIVIDTRPAMGIALRLHSALFQSQILAPIIERELGVSEEELAQLKVSFDPSAPGPEEVRQRSLVLRDYKRDRKIPIDLYYSAQTRGPLIVMSHGFAADRRFMGYLAQHLASYGFSVVSIEHPGSSIETLANITLEFNPTKLLSASEFMDRPQDVSFVLDELEDLRDNWSYVYNKFDTEQVTVIGHSLGGSTALALAGAKLNFREVRDFCQQRTPIGRTPADWLQCSAATLPHSEVQLRDKRITRAIALNPLVGQLFGKTGLKHLDTPILLLSSSGDVITPGLDHQLRPFQEIDQDKYFVSVTGATHMSVTDLANLGSAMSQGTLVREVIGEEAAPVRRLVKGLSLAFVEQSTDNQQIYKPFLTAAYVQALSTPRFSMRLTHKFPRGLQTALSVVESSHQALFEPQEEEVRSPWNFVAKRFQSVKKMFSPPSYCQGQLKQIFSNLLDDEPT